MLVDFQSLQSFDLNRLMAAQQDWSLIEDALGAQCFDYEQSVTAPVNDGTWTGTAATDAQRRVARSLAGMVATTQYLDTVRQALGGAVTGIGAAQAQLRRGLELAASHDVAVSADGLTSLSGGSVGWYDPPVLAAMDAQRMIYQGLFMAYNTDRDFVPILNYATKFGTSDRGPWLADAENDLAATQQVTELLPDQMSGLSAAGPPVRPDTDAQPYGVDLRLPLVDTATYDELFYGGVPYFAVHGWNNAAALLEHWLLNLGVTALVDPVEMMAAMPAFGAEVDTVFGPGGDGLYETGWINFSPGNDIQSQDWYYALNDFRYRIVGMIRTDDHGNQYRDYTVGVKKPYVFGPDIVVGGQVVGHRHDITVHGLPVITQAAMEHLHLVGIAQNFIVQGISHHSDRYGAVGTGPGHRTDRAGMLAV